MFEAELLLEEETLKNEIVKYTNAYYNQKKIHRVIVDSFDRFNHESCLSKLNWIVFDTQGGWLTKRQYFQVKSQVEHNIREYELMLE
jgi:uncharacterized protein YllA (UPF0747 family)